MTDSKQVQTANKFTEIAAKFMANSGQGHYQMERQGTTLDLAWYEDGSVFYLTMEITDGQGSRTESAQISSEKVSEELHSFVLNALPS